MVSVSPDVDREGSFAEPGVIGLQLTLRRAAHVLAGALGGG
jgi:hypothetical protein